MRFLTRCSTIVWMADDERGSGRAAVVSEDLPMRLRLALLQVVFRELLCAHASIRAGSRFSSMPQCAQRFPCGPTIHPCLQFSCRNSTTGSSDNLDLSFI